MKTASNKTQPVPVWTRLAVVFCLACLAGARGFAQASAPGIATRLNAPGVDRGSGLITPVGIAEGPHPAWWLLAALGGAWLASMIRMRALGQKIRAAGRELQNETTGRKRAEAVLDSVIHNLPVAMFIKDAADLRFLMWNKASEKLCGISRVEAVGHTGHELFPREQAEAFAARDREALAGSRLLEYEERLDTRYRGTRTLRARSIPLGNEDGQSKFLLTTIEDITQRKESEVALRESQALYHSLVEHLPVNVYRQDREGRFVFVNSRFCQFKGVTAEEILGKTLFDLSGREPAERFVREDDIVMGKGESIELEEEREDLGERGRYFHLVKSPVFNMSGEIIGLQGMFFDVTERKQAEAELAYERDLLRTLLDNSPDMIYFKDRESRFLKCSKSAYQRLGLGAGELIGKCDFELFGAAHAREAFEDEQEIIRTGEPLVGKIDREVWRDGREDTWILTSKMPLRNAAGEIIGTFGISKDITAIKQAEEKLKEVHRQLLHTSRLAGMAEVATSVLHNVGNVLNSVNISCSIVAQKVSGSKVPSLGRATALLEAHAGDLPTFFAHDPKAGHLAAYLTNLAAHLTTEQQEILVELGSLSRNIDHIKEIVAMQQNYARVSGVIESLQVVDLVEDALRMIDGALERHQVQLIREYSQVPPVTVDKHKVLQILVNLLRNAQNAIDEAQQADKRITLRVGLNGGQKVKIAVIDNGVGIPRENLVRIFQHGFTTRKDGHGFGLHSGALAARELGGALTVHSDGPGTGAMFTLEIPCQPENKSE